MTGITFADSHIGAPFPEGGHAWSREQIDCDNTASQSYLLTSNRMNSPFKDRTVSCSVILHSFCDFWPDNDMRYPTTDSGGPMGTTRKGK